MIYVPHGYHKWDLLRQCPAVCGNNCQYATDVGRCHLLRPLHTHGTTNDVRREWSETSPGAITHKECDAVRMHNWDEFRWLENLHKEELNQNDGRNGKKLQRTRGGANHLQSEICSRHWTIETMTGP